MRSLHRGLLLLTLPAALAAQNSAPQLPLAEFEDYRAAAGRMDNGELRVDLEARVAGWRPWGHEGPLLRAHAFAQPGEPARVPGPMIRATAGTPVAVTVHNTLQDTLWVRGLRDRGQAVPAGEGVPATGVLPFLGDSLRVAPGETRTVRFTPTVPGSYYWFGRATPALAIDDNQVGSASGPDNALVGVLIVDDPAEPPDPDERILLITQWADPAVPESWSPAVRFLVNGRSWPHTERLVYQQGDTVRWRVINQSGAFHPMHLHGFYFTVDDWTTQTGRVVAGPRGSRPPVVTTPLSVSTALRMWWVAEAPGNWLFHCHFMRHMSAIQGRPAATRWRTRTRREVT